MKKIILLLALMLAACSGKPEIPEPEPAPGIETEARFTVTGYREVIGVTDYGETFVFTASDEPDALYTSGRSHRLVYVYNESRKQILAQVSVMPNDVQVLGATLYMEEQHGTVAGHRTEPLKVRDGLGGYIILTVTK